MENMTTKKALTDAKVFFESKASWGWGHLIRKKKERTEREEEISEARAAYLRGVSRAWEIYTKDNEIVKQAEKILDKAIGQARELYLRDEEEMSDDEYKRANELFFKAVLQAHDDYAEKIAPVWKTFKREMRKKRW